MVVVEKEESNIPIVFAIQTTEHKSIGTLTLNGNDKLYKKKKQIFILI